MSKFSQSIGGYFELELKKQKEYHPNALSLNTGRNALEYILKARSYDKIYMPYFTCGVMMQPIQKLGIQFEFYSINEQFEPIFDFSKIKEKECFLYTNYFGLKDSYVEKLTVKCKNIIIDNAQSFYSIRINNIDTFYSPRKFFGVSDGAYLYSDKKIKDSLKRDVSYLRFEHLLRRIDENAEGGYSTFCKNDEKLNNMHILEMSNLTKLLLKSIDYELIAKQRVQNYLFLAEKLGKLNKLKITFNANQIPMVYPFWGSNKLRKKLSENKIYTATYWSNSLGWYKNDSLEAKLVDEIIYLPIDQRYTLNDMNILTNILKENI